MIITYKVEWYGEEGYAARNKERDRRVKQRKELEIKNSKLKAEELVPIPASLYANAYTEAHKIGNFFHMVYGLWWEERST